MAQALRKHATDTATDVRRYRNELEPRLGAWGVQADCARMRTASACCDLLTALSQADGDPVVALAQAQLDTSASAMGAIMSRGAVLAQTLRSAVWNTLDAFRAMGREGSAAVQVLDGVKNTLAADEHVTALGTQLESQQRAALALMAPPAAPPTQQPRTSATHPGARNIVKRSADRDALRDVMHDLEKSMSEDASLRVDIDCRLYHPNDDEVSSS